MTLAPVRREDLINLFRMMSLTLCQVDRQATGPSVTSPLRAEEDRHRPHLDSMGMVGKWQLVFNNSDNNNNDDSSYVLG